MQVSLVDESQLEAWQAFVENHLHQIGPYHHAGWYAILKECFAVQPYYLQATDEGGLVTGILPLYLSRSRLMGTHLASMYGGAVSVDPAATELLFEEAFRIRDRTKARYLYVKAGDLPSARPDFVSDAVGTRLKVQADPDAWHASLPRKTRKAIRLAEEAGYTVQQDDSAIDAFYEVYATNMRDLGTPVTGPAMFHAMRRHLAKTFRLYLVGREGLVAGGLICVNDATTWYPLYASVLNAYKPEYPNYLMYWTAMADAARVGGVQVFDLGRSTPNSGNHFFKQKWHGEDSPVPHHYYVRPGSTVDPAIAALRESLSLKQRVWQRLPLPIANRLGPSIRRQLPFA